MLTGTPCTCGGNNENCYKCYGSGIYNRRKPKAPGGKRRVGMTVMSRSERRTPIDRLERSPDRPKPSANVVYQPIQLPHVTTQRAKDSLHSA